MTVSLVTVLTWYIGKAFLPDSPVFSIDPVWPGLVVSLFLFTSLSLSSTESSVQKLYKKGLKMSTITDSWLYLYGAIALEVAGTYSLKMSDGFSRILPSLCVVIFYCISFVLMSLAACRFDLGVVYVVWSGVGIIAIFVISVFFSKNHFQYVKLSASQSLLLV